MHKQTMTQTRRRFLLGTAGAWTGLIAGCLQGAPGVGVGNGDNGNETDCDPIDLALVDDPPHGPTRPPQPGREEEDEWDDHHLGDGIDETTELAFDRINLQYHEPPVDAVDFGDEHVARAELVTDRDAFDEVVSPVDNDSEDRADEIDFDEEAVVIVLSGFGSSSVSHEWVRVEGNCEEIHVHGYYVWPYVQTADVTHRVSGIVVERPDGLERAWISLTIDEDMRVNVHSDEDMQVVDE